MQHPMFQSNLRTEPFLVKFFRLFSGKFEAIFYEASCPDWLRKSVLFSWLNYASLIGVTKTILPEKIYSGTILIIFGLFCGLKNPK